MIFHVQEQHNFNWYKPQFLGKSGSQQIKRIKSSEKVQRASGKSDNTYIAQTVWTGRRKKECQYIIMSYQRLYEGVLQGR